MVWGQFSDELNALSSDDPGDTDDTAPDPAAAVVALSSTADATATTSDPTATTTPDPTAAPAPTVPTAPVTGGAL